MSTLVKLLVVIIALLLASTPFAQSLLGKVIGVSDGDTVEVLDDNKSVHKIRLAGIDAPEKAQPFGQRSKENLSKLVFGKRVVVIGNKIDRYGRLVGKITVDGLDANLEQVKAGFAWHYKQYSNEQTAADRAGYANAEDRAREQRLGLWRETSPIPPWEWRQGAKSGTTTPSASTDCACGTGLLCVGKRGGQYCLASNGKKKYQSRSTSDE